MTNTLTVSKRPLKPAASSKVPSAEMINQAWDEFCISTTIKALRVGQMLREKREEICGEQHNQHTKADELWSKWLEKHCKIPERTVQRWMEMAGNVVAAALTAKFGHDQIDHNAIDVEGVAIPLSTVMNAELKELPKGAQEARQLLFDFAGDKTMKQCLSLVIVEGKEAHSIVRAHNGRTKGGRGNVDRKDFPVFVETKLQHVASHLDNKLAADQKAQVATHFVNFMKVAPRWLLEAIAPAIKEEIKLSDSDRAQRKEDS